MAQSPQGLYTNWQEIYVQPYSLVSAGGIDPSAANEFVFALHFSLRELPTINLVISASDYGAFPTFGSGSWIEIYGTNLASFTQGWTQSEFNGLTAPTTVGGTSATVGGQPAYIDYVSPTQVDALVAGGLGTGLSIGGCHHRSWLKRAVPSHNGYGAARVARSPNFDIGGTQYVVALFSDGTTYVLPPGAISGVTSKLPMPGDAITLYGIGFGQVNQGIPPGQMAQGETSLAAPLTISIGGKPATITYMGLAPGSVGLYQFNVTVPNIAASHAAPLTFTLGGVSGTQKLFLAVGN